MFRKLVTAVLLALALGACTLLPRAEEKLPPPAQAPAIELTREQGGRFIAFAGPRLQHTQAFLGVSDTNFFLLRSWLDNKTGEVAHQVYVEDSYYGGPFNWHGVHDADGMPLKFVAISRNQISCDQGCAYADEFAAALPDDYLKSHRSGFGVTFTAGDGKTLAVQVPGDLVAAQLDAIAAVRATEVKAANKAPDAKPTDKVTPAKPADSAAPPPAAAAASPTPLATPAAAVSAPPALPPGTVVPAPP